MLGEGVIGAEGSRVERGVTVCRLALPGCGSPGGDVVVDGSGQTGCGMAAMLAKTATIAAAHGQVCGIRSRRRRAPWVSRAGTCQSR